MKNNITTHEIRRWRGIPAFCILTLTVCAFAWPSRGAGNATPPIKPIWPPAHPVIACTTHELARLRAAYHGKERTRAPVAERVKSAEKALLQPIIFPPRGGQHNQWYQCDTCQMALKTIDATHHQCRKCKHVYTGEPYDDVVFSRVHYDNLGRLYDTAWAYAMTGDSKFAAFARQILLGYADRYQQYPYHSAGRSPSNKTTGGYLFEQTLDEAWCLSSQIAPAYDLIHDAPAMTLSDHQRIREGLLIPMLANIAKYKAGKSNWQTWHNAAMLWGGAVLHDATWITRAIADPDNGFYRQMETSITPDGMWYENSWGYHFYTLSAMVEIAEGARRLGVDLWVDPRFKAMFTLPVRYAMPDGSLPRLGDDVNTRVDSARRYLEFAYHALNDESMLPYLVAQPTWDAVLLGRDTGRTGQASALGSEVFAGAGHAILRSAGANGLAAAMTFGPYGGFHGHFDKLSFVFFGLGTELGVDPGRAASQAYRLPIHKDWYKATLSHNTVLVDRRSQAGVSGALKLFVANDAYAAALATCDTAYPGTRHQRLLVLTPSYLLVFDTLDSDTERCFDWLYHNCGIDAVCDAATKPGMRGDAFPGSEYIANIRTGVTDGILRVQFKNKDVITHLTMAAEPKTEVLVGDGPGASVDDRVPLTLISRHGKQARFAAILEPVRTPQPATAASLRVTDRDGTVRLEILQGDATDTVVLDGKDSVHVSRNGEIVLQSK